MSDQLDVESANNLLQKVQEGLVKVGNSVQGGVSKDAFLQEIWSSVHSCTNVKKCHLVCEAATSACTCAEDLAAAEAEEEQSAEADADEPEAAAEEEDAIDDTPPTADDGGCPEDFQETAGFVPETVASDIPETYPLKYMICGPSLYPENADCSCGGNYQGTDWRIIPPKNCPQCDGKKICGACNGAGLKAAKKACPACSKKKGKCPTCSGEKFVKCTAKGCVKGNLTRPRKCDLCGGRGQMMVWDGKMAFFFNQNPSWTEKIKFRGLTIEPKVWGPIAGKCESDHGCFFGLKSAFKGEYKADPTGQYPLGIMEVVVDTQKKCGNGTRYVKFLGKLKKSGTDTFKWCKDGSLYGDDERSGYFRGGWIELFQTWAPCEMCGDSKTPGFVGTEEVDCPDCEAGKKPCPKCKKLPGKCLKCKGKGEIPTTHDCKACDDGNCPACAGVGKTPEQKIKVKAICPVCGDSGKTGAKHALVPKFERLFVTVPWHPPAEEKHRLYFSESAVFFGLKARDPEAYLGDPAAWHLAAGKTLRCQIKPETVVEWMDMGRGRKMKFESLKYWCIPEQGNQADGKYFHNPERRILKLYFGPEDNLGEPVTYWQELLDIEHKDEDPVAGGSRERGFILKPEGIWAYSEAFAKQITYIDVTPDVVPTQEIKRRVCEIRMKFDGAIYLGAGNYKVSDIPVHPTKFFSIWTGWSDRGYGATTCLLFEGFESEDCTGKPVQLQLVGPRTNPKGECNQYGDHRLWDMKINSFRIFPKEGCDEKTFWGKDTPRWPIPPPLSTLPDPWNMDQFVWRTLYGCTDKKKEYIRDDGQQDFTFETWEERWRRIWKDEACHLFGMTVDYRMLPPPPEPEPPAMPDFNGKWLIKYKAYFGVKEHIEVKDNKFTHKGKNLVIDPEEGLIVYPDKVKQTVQMDNTNEDFIEWRHWGRLGFITWTRED